MHELLERDNARLEEEIAAYTAKGSGRHGVAASSTHAENMPNSFEQDAAMAGRQLAAVQQLLQRQDWMSASWVWGVRRR